MFLIARAQGTTLWTLLMQGISLLNTFRFSILGTNVFYNNCLHTQFIIVYNILGVLNYLLVYFYPVSYIFPLNILMIL